MDTLDLFTPRARHTDPASSIAAAREVEANGTLQAQQARVLAAVHDFPGRSSYALAVAARIDRYTVARRLPELVGRGLVIKGPMQRCALTNRLALTWMPKP